jgi:hypothetical protein
VPEKTASPLLDGEAPAGWDTIVRVQKMYFDPPDIDGRMPRVNGSVDQVAETRRQRTALTQPS